MSERSAHRCVQERRRRGIRAPQGFPPRQGGRLGPDGRLWGARDVDQRQQLLWSPPTKRQCHPFLWSCQPPGQCHRPLGGGCGPWGGQRCEDD